MQLHLIKLAVGCSDFADLQAFVEQRKRQGVAHAHVTRHMPKQADELIGRGSLYWVIAGAIQARQPIVDLQTVEGGDGIQRCAIVLAPALVRVAPRPKRPFQGWRYLKGEEAPPDLDYGFPESEPMPAGMAEELHRLGVL